MRWRRVVRRGMVGVLTAILVSLLLVTGLSFYRPGHRPWEVTFVARELDSGRSVFLSQGYVMGVRLTDQGRSWFPEPPVDAGEERRLRWKERGQKETEAQLMAMEGAFRTITEIRRSWLTTWWWREGRWVQVSLLPPIILVGLACAGAWWMEARDHVRRRKGRCARCGYDLSGLLRSAKCPECGTVPAPDSVRCGRGSTGSMARPRLRRALKWGSLAALFLTGLMWAVSVRYYVIHGDQTGVRCVGLSMGTVWYAMYEFGMPGWEVEPAPRPLECFWRFKFKWEPIEERMICAPLWVPCALLVLPTAFLWWRDSGLRRRLRRGVCHSCGYDRRGLASDAKCPECGTVPSK